MIRSISKYSLAATLLCGAVLSLSTPARAQDPFDLHVIDVTILPPKPVQNELGITLKQRDQLNKYADIMNKQVQDYFAAQQKKGVNPNQIRPGDPQIVSYYENLKRNISRVLTAAQMRRLRELTIQARGYALLLDPVIEKRLDLKNDQVSRIRTALETFARFAQEKDQGAVRSVQQQYANVKPKDRPDAERLQKEFVGKVRAARLAIRPEVIAAHQKMDKSVEEILTAPQRATWKSLAGKTFTGK